MNYLIDKMLFYPLYKPIRNLLRLRMYMYRAVETLGYVQIAINIVGLLSSICHIQLNVNISMKFLFLEKTPSI